MNEYSRVAQCSSEIAFTGAGDTAGGVPQVCLPVTPSTEGTVDCRVYFSFDDLTLPSGNMLTGCQDLPFLEAVDKWAPSASPRAHVCRVLQVPAPGGQPSAGGDGWYYVAGGVKSCTNGTPGAFRFTDGAQPPDGVVVQALCTETQTKDAGVAVVSASQCTLPADSARHTSTVGDACLPESMPATGYDDREVYVETRSPQCGTGVCLVFHLRGDPSPDCNASSSVECTDPNETKDRIYCSCRCDAPAGEPGALCACADGFSCIHALAEGPSGVGGSYCVRNGTFTVM